MTALMRALSAETLKTKRTLALAMTGLAPLVIALLQFALYLKNGGFVGPAAAKQPWLSFTQTMLAYWALLMMPLFITLETALLSALDQGNSGLRLLYTMPLPRWSLYVAKQVISLALVALSMVVLLGLTLVVARLLGLFLPGMVFDAPVPWPHILKFALLIYLSAWLLISFHLWVSARSKNMVLALAVGIAGTIIAIFAINNEWAMFYPWTMPGSIVVGMVHGTYPAQTVLLGALGGILLAVAACWDISRQDVL